MNIKCMTFCLCELFQIQHNLHLALGDGYVRHQPKHVVLVGLGRPMGDWCPKMNWARRAIGPVQLLHFCFLIPSNASKTREVKAVSIAQLVSLIYADAKSV